MRAIIPCKSTVFAVVLFNLLVASAIFAQEDEDKVGELDGKIEGLTERTATLESSVLKLNQLKISGYVQPQWVWTDIDTLANQVPTRNFFQIRRGRIKFTHATVIDPITGFSNVSAVIYPDIIETGVTIREVYAKWDILTDQLTSLPELSLQVGSMNRPFGYEIAYSSSSRELAERSTAENRLFNGERDLGAQIAWSPTILDFRPVIEVGLFNGTDNFGRGPSNILGFSTTPIGTRAAFTTAQLTGPDSAFRAQVNVALGRETVLGNAAGGTIKQNQKELLGHIRLPFLISDELSFDIGGSLSLGGIYEPSDVIGKYTGTNGALVLTKSDDPLAPHDFNPTKGANNNTFLGTNRSVIGADLQVYLSVLPIGGTILKGEMYTGQVPFYGSAGLFTQADSAALGVPTASTIYKNVFGFYAALVQNITDNFQLAIRYDVYDPNTDVEGANVAFLNGSTVSTLRGVSTSSGFGGDMSLTTLSVALNAYVSGAIRFMLNYDHPMTEEFTKAAGTEVVTQGDPKDDRITVRMQYMF